MDQDMEFVPKNRVIDKDDVLNLSDKQIKILKKYFEESFPDILSSEKYSCIGQIEYVISKIFENLNDGDVVIAPGDSPSKIVKIIQIVFGDNDNYIFEENQNKYIRFINFPISSISFVDSTVIDKYLLKILTFSGIEKIDNMKYLDFIEQGRSYKNIAQSLQRIFRKEYMIPTINLKDFQPENQECQSALKLITDISEGTTSRCLPNFNLYDTKKLPDNSLLRCNTVIAIVSLLLLGKLF